MVRVYRSVAGSLRQTSQHPNGSGAYVLPGGELLVFAATHNNGPALRVPRGSWHHVEVRTASGNYTLSAEPESGP